MLGIAIVALIGIYMVAREQPLEVIFEKTTKFLYCWYIVIALFVGIVMTTTILVTGTVGGALAGGLLGALAGSMAGMTFALFALAWVAFSYVFQIFGAKLLHGSLSVNPDGTHTWNTTKIVIGTGLLLLGLGLLPILS